MGIIGKDFTYKVVKNFLSKHEAMLLATYCEIKHRLNKTNFDLTNNNVGDTCFYGDTLMDSLMINKQTLMEEHTGKKLLPTYSFWRCYTKYADLKKHRDRPSCEVSVTVNIASDGTKWPIFIEGVPVDLNTGDAAIYLGCDLIHWREQFQGDYQIQTFLHYVDAEGKNKNYHMDKRPYWGLQK